VLTMRQQLEKMKEIAAKAQVRALQAPSTPRADRPSDKSLLFLRAHGISSGKSGTSTGCTTSAW
jgi:hypothetical protein